MTLAFLNEYIPQFMRGAGFGREEYYIEWVEIPVRAGSMIEIETTGCYYFYCMENASIAGMVKIESVNGIVDFTNGANLVLSYIHQGAIRLNNTDLANNLKVKFIVAHYQPKA